MKVLVTGVFDLLHIEHIRFLKAAKEIGDKLVVGIESDKRVRELKGPNRPIIPESERLELVQAIKFVDEAFVIRRDAGSSRMRNAVNNVSRMAEQEEAATDGCETHYHRECRAKLGSQSCLANIKQEKATIDILECYKKLLLKIKPDVYAVSENSPHLETKKLLCRETGVELRVVWPENAAVSTSKLIEKIKNS